MPDTGEVDVDEVLPRPLVQLPRRAEGSDPGVGADDVDVPECFEPLGHGLVQLGLRPDIGLSGHDAPAEFLDQRHRLLEIVFGGEGVFHAVDLFHEVDGDDVGAFLGQPDRMRTTLASGRSGDKGDFPPHPFGHRDTFIHTLLVSVSSRIDSSPRVRPCPDCLTPPYGTAMLTSW